MEKENVLEIEITKINDEYSLAKVKKINNRVIKEKEEYSFGYANSSSLKMNSIIYTTPSFRTGFSDTIECFDLFLHSKDDCFIIKNKLVESLKTFLKNFNEKYGIPKRWRAEENKTYYLINYCGHVCDVIEENIERDNEFFEQGNYFKTKEEAEKVKIELDKFWERVRNGEIRND